MKHVVRNLLGFGAFLLWIQKFMKFANSFHIVRSVWFCIFLIQILIPMVDSPAWQARYEGVEHLSALIVEV